MSKIPLILADELVEYLSQFCVIKDIPKIIEVCGEKTISPSIYILMGLRENLIPEDIRLMLCALPNEQR